MTLMRCPSCGRVASGPSCLACGHDLTASSSGASPARDDVFDVDELGVVTEAGEIAAGPPPTTTRVPEPWAVRAPGQPLDVLTSPRPRPPAALFPPPVTPAPVVEGLALTDADDGLAVVTGAVLEEPPVAVGHAVAAPSRAGFDPFSPFSRTTGGGGPPSVGSDFGGRASTHAGPDDGGFGADLANMSALAASANASLDGVDDALVGRGAGFIDELSFDVGESAAGVGHVSSSNDVGGYAGEFGIEMTEGLDLGASPDATSDVGSTSEVDEGFELTDGFDIDGASSTSHTTDGADMAGAFDDAFAVPSDAYFGGEVGASTTADPHGSGGDFGALEFGGAAEPAPVDDDALRAAFFNNDDLDLPPTSGLDGDLAASTSADATELIARPARPAFDDDEDATALLRAPALPADASLPDDLPVDVSTDADDFAAGLGDGFAGEAGALDAPLSHVDAQHDTSHRDIELDDDPFAGLVEQPPSSTHDDSAAPGGAADAHAFAIDDVETLVSDDEVPEPPPLDDLGLDISDQDATLPLVARPSLASLPGVLDDGDASTALSQSSAVDDLSVSFADLHVDEARDEDALSSTDVARRAPAFTESAEAFAVEVAPMSRDAPGTVRATLDDDGALVPPSSLAQPTRVVVDPLEAAPSAAAFAERVDEPPITIERSYARDLSARILPLAEDLEGAGRFEAAALLYEIQAILDGN